MSESICSSCRRSKTVSPCEVCHQSVCQDCRQFLDASTFSFLEKIPEDLSHSHYCQACYDLKVEPALTQYQEVMDRAKKVFVFFKTQRRPAPVSRRSKEKIQVNACDDRDETILRLAFFAA